MDTVLERSILNITDRISDILCGGSPSVYLHGSAVLDDFKPGWSDIDILVLTKKPITENQAHQLVCLRQKMLEETPSDPYYRCFEGGMLTLDAFKNKNPDTVVYWGTSGQKITDNYVFDSFSMTVLLENGRVLCGDDLRGRFTEPTYGDLINDVEKHLDSVRRFAHLSGRSLYSFGWMLDISRCIYTVRTGGIISKTDAGEWALKEELCPSPEVLEYALKVRRSPLLYKNDDKALSYAETINGDIQSYASVLEKELK